MTAGVGAIVAGVAAIVYPSTVGEGSDVVPDEEVDPDEYETVTPILDLPTNPDVLKEDGFIETTHPNAAENGHRKFKKFRHW